MNQAEKAAYFKSLHIKGDPLVLYNIWDAGGAKALADAGAKATATSSWSMAAAHGFEDGESISLEFVLQIVERIAEFVDLPLTVDFEGAYAAEPYRVAQNVQKVLNAGAVGINFEDQVVKGEVLYSIVIQAERIKAARKVADDYGIPIFINARTDLFSGSDQSIHEAMLSEAIERVTAYAEAGADGFFIPGLTDLQLVKRIVDKTNLPVNVMLDDLASISEAAHIGVSRVSFGPVPYFNAMSNLSERYRALK